MPFIRILLTGIAKLLSKVFSMATLTFFGRIPTQDSSIISFMGIASLYWLYIAASVLFPDLAEMFIPFIPDDETLIRIISIALAILLPLSVGFASTKIENRDKDFSFVKQLLMGFPYSFILGSLSMLLVVIIPLLKLPSLLKMHRQEQFAIMIRKGKYDKVLDEITSILKDYDLHVSIHDPKKPVWYCFVVLSFVLEHIFNKKISKKMNYINVEIDNETVEVTIHATDISILGPKNEVLQVKHILSEELKPEHLFFSWDDSVQQIEDEINQLNHKVEKGESFEWDKLQDITARLRRSSLENEDWNAIRRQIYKLERDYYQITK
ncbi:hypothetical protein [Salipaludibacillus daqingensis]|uniref:hypothetical protein n=1 Tax=Salipaludibacillus daqingensis TaxID=3041001 RepID=UPI0024744A2F|nr:hypothetical protein [Salipaludibacillus daqingensis]